MNALVYIEHRPGDSQGEKSDEHLQCSPWSWLDDFMQPFSCHSSLSRALDFLNKLFLPGVACACILNMKLVKPRTFYTIHHLQRPPFLTTEAFLFPVGLTLIKRIYVVI